MSAVVPVRPLPRLPGRSPALASAEAVRPTNPLDREPEQALPPDDGLRLPGHPEPGPAAELAATHDLALRRTYGRRSPHREPCGADGPSGARWDFGVRDPVREFARVA